MVFGKGEIIMRKHGKRNVEHYKRYKSEDRRLKNKLKRILRSNGIGYAETYARKNQCIGILSGMR